MVVEDRVQGLGRAVRAAPAAGLRGRGRAARPGQRADLRPLPALAARRRPCAVRAVLAGGGRRAHQPGATGHQRAHPHLPVQPGDHRPGLRHAGLPVPGPDAAGHRHRRGAQRGGGGPAGVAGLQAAVRPAARGGRADAAAVVAGAGHLRRASTTSAPTPPSTTGPSTRVPVYIAAGGPVVAKYAGRAGDGFICTSGKGAELYTGQADARRQGGRWRPPAGSSTSWTG